MRILKDHLGNVRFSYILFQAKAEEVEAYNSRNFFQIQHAKLPDDVR